MKNIKVIIVGFIVIAIAAAIHLSMKKGERVAILKKAASAFALIDTSGIDKIIIFDGKEEIIVRKQQKSWSYNGSELANKPAITELLNVMLTIKPVKPINDSLMDKVAIELRTNGVKIQFYAGDIEDRAFYVGSFQNQTIMMMVSTGAPHFVICEAYNEKVFELFKNSLSDFKSTNIFTSTAQSIQSVELISKTLNPYLLTYDAGNFKYLGSASIPNQNEIKLFFNKLIDLKIEQYENVLVDMKPIAVLQLTDVDPKRDNTIEILRIDTDKVLIKNVNKKKIGYIALNKFKELIAIIK